MSHTGKGLDDGAVAGVRCRGRRRGNESERGTEQQMDAEAIEHLDRQISCYAQDPPQGTSG